MSGEIPKLRTKILRHAPSPRDFDVYRAALEWSLVEPIVFDGRDDLRSEATWRDRVKPYQHQVTNLITFCRRLPVTLLADDVGLGKTISAGLIASELIARHRVKKILVVAPKLLGPQWKEELESKFNLPTLVTRGKELIDAEPSNEFGAVVTTYHAAREHIQKLPEDRFHMLVLDEAHKLRNLFGVPSPPQVALRFREVLKERVFRYVLMLTATPIQNRLWDLYSLVELLSVARGHDNPLGREGMFVRRFIADGRMTARQMKREAQDEFRAIIYDYMSRVRRRDANLHFPDRIVLSSAVRPTHEELELFGIIAQPLKLLKNRLAQISILQALASSPDALAAQLSNMARNGTFPANAAEEVKAFVKRMPLSAKLKGLALLVEQLRKENPVNWRMVIFTQRRETQTTIEAYLQAENLSVGVINGDSGDRNQETIARFRANPPELHVIVSTEAGSEGVNLQAANVLVNYDLPWNPMIVEQRIGRVQRLASEHAKVFVYSVILSQTFEEYIVGRLMEKLQMASHAIGDIEALLEASGMEGSDDDADSFAEQIRKLVMDSLEGKDIEAAMRMAEESIEKAQQTLKEEEDNINTLLGGMEGAEEKGPSTPNLPSNEKSLTFAELVSSALQFDGASVHREGGNTYTVNKNGHRERVCIAEELPGKTNGAIVYSPGSSAFDRLLSRVTQSGLHDVVDAVTDTSQRIEDVCRQWVTSFEGQFESVACLEVVRQFAGTALVKVRATVAHDSYERLLTLKCSADQHCSKMGAKGLHPLAPVIENPAQCGIDTARLTKAALLDESIAEFCRFYTDRRERELQAVKEDERKRKKLIDDFTPRLQTSLVGLQGEVDRIVSVRVEYIIDSKKYHSEIRLLPAERQVAEQPAFGRCAKMGCAAPVDALAQCTQSGQSVLRHLLVASDVSGRLALPEHFVECSLTHKTILLDEAITSAVTKKTIARAHAKSSILSGAIAEPEYFGRCEFTQMEALLEELARSDVSGRFYRADQSARSVISGKMGHASEFIECGITHQQLLRDEAEQCEITGTLVVPGYLERCARSGKMVLPTELRRSEVSGRQALKHYLVQSSLSEVRMLEDEAVWSRAGFASTPDEAIHCVWSGRVTHPDDIRVCELTGLRFYYIYMTNEEPYRHNALLDLLRSPKADADRSDTWSEIEEAAAALVGGKATVEATLLSPNKSCLATTAEDRKYLGFKVRLVGALYSLTDRRILGRITVGRRKNGRWEKL